MKGPRSFQRASPKTQLLKEKIWSIGMSNTARACFPVHEKEVNNINQDFYAIQQFPGVVGAIDCTHIPISNPGGPDANNYINRKGWMSVNVHSVCSASLIFNIVARWPGTPHDLWILSEWSLCRRLADGRYPRILLGDPGYTCTEYLITPLQNGMCSITLQT